MIEATYFCYLLHISHITYPPEKIQVLLFEERNFPNLFFRGVIVDSSFPRSNFSVIPVVTDIAMDWSDHALWWPARNHWLTRTRSTLDQYGVAADAVLHFTPMHKTLRVQLPDMRCLDCRVDFSVKTFNAVINLCKELGESRTH